ncbi:MAG: FAD-dependent oxidoreductase, partial [Limibacillus sp.]
MQRYSVFSLLGNALTGNRNWERAWRDPDPKPEYDVIVIGGGGHGLSTAYYLAKEHGVRKVALLEKGYLGGGNVGRNTTIVRSNYMIPGNTEFYELSLKLWEELSRDLNYNVMFSQRGQVSLATSPAQMEAYSRRGNVMRMNGIDAELLDREQLMKLLPYLDYSPSARYRLHGGMIQQRAGTARHDAVAWGYARGASNRGVDLIQQCEVLGFLREGDRIVGVETTKGPIRAKKVAMAVAGSTTTLA